MPMSSNINILFLHFFLDVLPFKNTLKIHIICSYLLGEIDVIGYLNHYY